MVQFLVHFSHLLFSPETNLSLALECLADSSTKF